MDTPPKRNVWSAFRHGGLRPPCHQACLGSFFVGCASRRQKNAQAKVNIQRVVTHNSHMHVLLINFVLIVLSLRSYQLRSYPYCLT